MSQFILIRNISKLTIPLFKMITISFFPFYIVLNINEPSGKRGGGRLQACSYFFLVKLELDNVY